MPRWTREKVRSLDETDELAPLRQQFQIPPGIRYFNGNSLGLLSRPAEAALFAALEAWRSLGGEAWFRGEQPWLELVAKAAALMAPLVGAEPEALTVANSTTVNLHQLLSTLFHPTSGRRKILVDETIFCSDLYAVRSHLKLRSLDPDADLVVVPTADGALLEEGAIVERMTGDVACAVLSSVVYNTGQLLDLARITRAARERGIVIGFDCSHSVGCVPHDLSRWDADFAFWCGYKYLNGGPGASFGNVPQPPAFWLRTGTGRLVRLPQGPIAEHASADGGRGRRRGPANFDTLYPEPVCFARFAFAHFASGNRRPPREIAPSDGTLDRIDRRSFEKQLCDCHAARRQTSRRPRCHRPSTRPTVVPRAARKTCRCRLSQPEYHPPGTEPALQLVRRLL